MHWRSPIFILPLLVLAAVLLDRVDTAWRAEHEAESADPRELASAMVTQDRGPSSSRLHPPGADAASGAVQIQIAVSELEQAGPERAIAFELQRPGYAQLSVYDARGRRVQQLLAGVCNAGEQRLVWDACNDEGVPAPPGVYFARLEYLGQVQSARFALD